MAQQNTRTASPMTRNMTKYLGSRTVYVTAIVAWIIKGLLAIFWLAPNVDDGLYLDQSMTVFHSGIPGTWIGNHFHPVFFDMPTFPLINGLFYKLLAWIGLTPDIYSYQAFIFICWLLVLIMSLRLIASINPVKSTRHFAQNIFMLALAVSPFVLNYATVRPEPLALVFLVSALFYLFKASDQHKSTHWFCAGLLLGLAGIVHPVFLLYGGLIGLMALIQLAITGQIRTLTLTTLAALIPIALFALFFGYFYHEAMTQLGYRSQSVASHSWQSLMQGWLYLWNNINPFNNDHGRLVGLYYSLFSFPLVIIMIANLILLAKQNFRQFWQHPKQWLPIISLLASLVIISFIRMYGPYLLDITFFLTLTLAIQLQTRHQAITTTIPYKLKYITPACLIVVIIIGSSTIPHIAKFLLGKHTYYSAKNTKAAINKILQTQDIIVVTGQRLLPPLASLMAKSYGEKRQVYCAFCAGAGDQLTSKVWQRESQQFINKIILPHPIKHIIWGIMKPDIMTDTKDNVCFTLKGYHVPIKLIGVTTVYKDKGNYFYRAKAINVGKFNQACW